MISNTRFLVCEYPAQLALTRWLAQRNYYENYHRTDWGGLVPRGLTGSELLALSLKAEQENKKIFLKDPMEECARRAAL